MNGRRQNIKNWSMNAAVSCMHSSDPGVTHQDTLLGTGVTQILQKKHFGWFSPGWIAQVRT